MQSKSPFLRLWGIGESEHSGLIRAMVSAAAGVLGRMVPYYADFVLGRKEAAGWKLNA